MRYKKVQIIHTVVADEEINSIETAKNLFQNLSESSMSVSIRYLLPETDDVVLWEKTKIESIEEDKVNITIFFAGGRAKDQIYIKNIIFVGVVTDRSNIMSNKEEITRYDFLDLSDA